MTRPVDYASAVAASSPTLYVAVLVELDFTPDPIRIWSGVGDFQWDNATFTGAGSLLGVGSAEETTETRAVEMTLSLSGIPAEMIDHAMRADYRGRLGKVWLAILTEAGGLLGAPIPVFSGRMDVMSWSEGTACTISLTVESRLADLDRARVRRYTDRDQQAEFPGDLGFQFVDSLQEARILWGQGL